MSLHLCLVLPWVGVVSVIGLVAIGADKARARRRRRRLRERTLLVLATVGAAPGVWAGMGWFRHKTRHLRFRLLVPPLAILWVAIAAWTAYRCLV